MTRRRKRLVSAGLGCFVLLSALHAITGREHWPFSPYEMYSTPKPSRESRKLLLVAVGPSDEERWLLSRADLAPLNRARVGSVLNRARAADRSGGLGAAGEAPAASHLRNAFEQLVGVVAPNHPDAAAFRLYQATWELHPRATNLRTPETWIRLAEVQAPAVASSAEARP